MKEVIVIKENGVMSKELCAICKDTMKNTSPLGLFTEEGGYSVCRECAEEISPTIVKALDTFYKEEYKNQV